jgi:sec-independent protein translocase protein TatB
MFDIGFSELMLIGVVALIVLGPERLPKVARTAGTMMGRLNRYVASVKQDIDRDMKLEELRKLQDQMRETAQKYEIMAAEVENKAKDEASQVDRLMQAMAATEGGKLREVPPPEAEALIERVPDEEGANAMPSASEAVTAESPVSETPMAGSYNLNAEVEPDHQSNDRAAVPATAVKST